MKTSVIITLSVTGGLVIGFGSGYVIAQKRTEAHMIELAAKELTEAKEYYKKLYKREEFSDLSKMAKDVEEVPDISKVVDAEEYREKLSSLKYLSRDDSEEAEKQEDPPFDEEDDCEPPNLENPFVYEEEIKSRSVTRPYIITADEFFENETEYEQTTVSYFEGDEVLVDSADSPIRDIDNTVGTDNLMRFGHGSDQEHIVYIRNHKIEVEFEVTRSTGKYSEEVLGFIEHSDDRPKIRKFRGGDE